ncbi:MAG TPA: HAMP domain-containing sensor histidine kinase [Anaerolineae bacterium]|jgi:signal transduction histidine kinase
MTMNLIGNTVASLSVNQQMQLHKEITASLAQSRTVQAGCQSLVRLMCEACQPIISAGAIWLVDTQQELRTFGKAIAWPIDYASDIDTHTLNHVANAGRAEWLDVDPQPGRNAAAGHGHLYVLPVRNWMGTAGLLGLAMHATVTLDDLFSEFLEALTWQLGIFIEHHQFAGMSDAVMKSKLVEEELRGALAHERELNDMKTRFISLVSHEFRTPLSIIQSSSELLEHYYDRLTVEKRQRYFEQIRTSTMNMADMLQDILVLGRYDSGKTRFDPHPIDLTQYCRQCVEQIQQASGPKYQLVFEHRGVVEDARMDDKLLWQIINNLLSNAMKYSLQPDPIIEMTLDIDKDHAVLRIADHGIGIPPEDQMRLFEPFHRGSNVGAVPGTGLGLSIVQRAVQEHQGEVRFNSAVGKGTAFTIILPLR